MPTDLEAAANDIAGPAQALEGQSGQLLVDVQALAGQVARLTLRGFEAVQLWREWFTRYGDPWIEQDGELWCAFCDGEGRHHKRGCIYLRAKRLLEAE